MSYFLISPRCHKYYCSNVAIVVCRKEGGFIGEYTYKYVDIALVKKQPNANESDPSVLFATDIILELKLNCVSPRSRI